MTIGRPDDRPARPHRRPDRPPLVLLRDRRIGNAAARRDPEGARGGGRGIGPQLRPGSHAREIRRVGAPGFPAVPAGRQRDHPARTSACSQRGGGRHGSRSRPRQGTGPTPPHPRRPERGAVQRCRNGRRRRGHQRQVDRDRDARLDIAPHRPQSDDHERRGDEELRLRRRPLRQRGGRRCGPLRVGGPWASC